MARPHVVYVSGAPRSGTTLVSMALGQLSGACEIGELWALWGPAFQEGDACGCGAPVPECEFWTAVIQKALGPLAPEHGAEMGSLHNRHLGTARAPLVWAHLAGIAKREAYDEYARLLALHYDAIAEVSGARFIIDSSKMTSDALLASSIPGIDFSVIHLVRDPRGVAWSWQKAQRQSGPHGRPFAQRGALASAARWDAHNTFAQSLLKPRLGTRYRLVSYEDFVADPRTVLGSLAAWLGTHCDESVLAGTPAKLSLRQSRHPVWGNPLRSASGSVAITADEEWKSRLSPFDRVLTVGGTLPLLLRYDYAIRAEAPRRRSWEVTYVHH
jgi:hypothetical protein